MQPANLPAPMDNASIINWFVTKCLTAVTNPTNRYIAMLMNVPKLRFTSADTNASILSPAITVTVIKDISKLTGNQFCLFHHFINKLPISAVDYFPMERLVPISMNAWKRLASVRNIVQTHREAITANAMNDTMNVKSMNTLASERITSHRGSYSQISTICETCQSMAIK